MVNQYDVIRWFKKQDANEMKYKLDESEKNVINIETGKSICSVAEYTQFLRAKLHCDFEVVYCEHATLDTVYRCNECGTVIFGGDDERYDPNLCCPTCGDYQTSLEFWTKEEIEADEKKQNTFKYFEFMTKERNAQYERKKKRGLNDWEIWKTYFKTKKGRIELSLECNNLFHSGLKGLHFEITKWKKEADGCGLIWEKEYYIPLTIYSFKMWLHKRKFRKELLAKKEAESQSA